jgi:hypothetical protein
LLLGGFGLEPFLEATLKSRAFDQNNDGRVDSGADFWTGYLFHTRDVVRQSILDYVQLLRVLRSFDGERRWDFDLDGNGENELAGDFDGDGEVDVGLRSRYFATGGSLGGFMSSLLGAVEPHVTAVAPISGGGGIADLGIRSVQGGVKEGFILRAMGPLYVGTYDEEKGSLLLEAIVNDLNDDATLPIAELENVGPGDTVVALNLTTSESSCAYIAPEGVFRLGLASDLGDRHELRFYKGPALVTGGTECEVLTGLEPSLVVGSFGQEIDFQGQVHPAGDDLIALAEGLGLRRANPELRRFQPIAQMVMDPADPAVYSRHYFDEPLVYPNMGEETNTHTMIVTTLGDMNVPASGGITQGRAAGFIDYLNTDERYGKTPNQVLIDTFTAEAVHTHKRYLDARSGGGVHLDIENFSQGGDIWGQDIPRLDPPIHLWSDETLDGRQRAGYSGAIFPFPIPTGQHGFPFPGQLPDRAREACEQECDGDCSCDDVDTFDIGRFLFNMIGEYFRSGGTVFRADLCHSRGDCAYELPTPPERE